MTKRSLVLLFLGFLGSSLLTLAFIVLVGPLLADLSEGSEILHLVSDLDRFLTLGDSWLAHEMCVLDLLVGLSRFQLLSGGVRNLIFLVLFSSAWEQNQLALVGFETLNIGLKSLLGCVVSSVID